MKVSNKSNLAVGVVLLLLAAFFSIALILQPLDFGQFGPGHTNILYRLGAMIASVYGFSSILIPVFLFTAAISCFATKWTARKSMRLLTAVIPFFTCFGAEKLCNFFAKGGNFTALKITVTLVVAAMLVVIEFLLAGIAADRISGVPVRKKPVDFDEDDETSEDDSDSDDDYDAEDYDDSEEEEYSSYNSNAAPYGEADSTYEEDSTEENFETDSSFSETSPSNQSEEPSQKKRGLLSKIENLFEKKNSESKDKYESNEEIFENTDFSSDNKNTSEEIYDSGIVVDNPEGDDASEKKEDPFAGIFDYEKPAEKDDNKTEEDLSDDKNSDSDENSDNSDENKPSEIDSNDKSSENDESEESEDSETDEEPLRTGPLITQEEYAALTGIGEEEPEDKPDEIEWPDTEEIKARAGNSGDLSDFESDGDDFNDEELFSEVEKNIPEEEKYSDDSIFDDSEDDLDNCVQKCGVQEMSVFGNSDEKEDENTIESDFENSFSEYEKRINEDDISHEEDFSAGKEDDFSGEEYDIRSREEISDEDESADEKDDFSEDEIGLEDENSFGEEDDISGDEDSLSSGEPFQKDETFTEDEYSAGGKEDDVSGEGDELSEDEALDEEDVISEDENLDSDEEMATNENFYTPDDVLRQQRYEEQQKKSSLTSDVFDDMENDIRKEVKKEFLHKKYGAPEDYTEEYEENYTENDEEFYQEENENFQENDNIDENEDEIFIPVVKQASALQRSASEGKAGVLNERTTSLPPASSRAQPKKPYFVPTELLEQYADDQYWIIDEQTKQDAEKLKDTLNEFGISAEVIGIKKGPVVTMFELAPAPGVKLNRIASLQDNIALSLAAKSVRIVAPIPGRAAVGIEVPNRKRSIVSFREMIEQDLPEFKKMAVPVILGKDILGKSQIIDIAKTPHLLIAGATGAGKSVCVNSIILSILYKRSPKQVKMILVDPKVVELKLYNDIPHLLTPVITEPKKALQALQYCLCEMERRYALLDQMGVRDISSYNTRIEERNICTEKLPYIVIIIDEFADLMATSGKELESNVARLAAMSRAVGIHLVLATQRPSVNVITGLIKANIPSRIAFTVATRTDSNIIIDAIGAEKLLGKGDMLYASAVDPYPVRIQGTFESDNDVEKVVEYVKTLGEPEYIDDEIFFEDEEEEITESSLFGEGSDPLYEQALDIVLQAGKASASYIQRRLKIGYNRAARLVEEMEERGIVGPANGSKPREVIHVPS